MATPANRREPQFPPVVHRGCRLREFGMTDKDLALLLDVTPLTAARIRRGCDLKLSHALKIAKHYGCSVEDIWRQQHARAK